MVKSPWFSRTTGPKIMQLGSAQLEDYAGNKLHHHFLMPFFFGGGCVVLLVFGLPPVETFPS